MTTIDLETKLIPMSAVVTDDSFNVRSSYDSVGKDGQTIPQLAADLKRNGQIMPVIVAPLPGGTFFLVAGYRRHKALTLNSATEIRATIDPSAAVNGDSKDARLRALQLNIVENLSRENLRPYDIAARCLLFATDYKLEGSEIARSITKSPSYVNNLLFTIRNLDKSIATEWKAGNGKATTDDLRRIAGLSADDQVSAWRTLCETGQLDGNGDNGAPGAAGGRPGPAGRPAGRVNRPSKLVLVRLVTWLEAGGKADGLAVARYCLGLVGKIEGFKAKAKVEADRPTLKKANRRLLGAALKAAADKTTSKKTRRAAGKKGKR